MSPTSHNLARDIWISTFFLPSYIQWQAVASVFTEASIDQSTLVYNDVPWALQTTYNAVKIKYELF